MNLTALSKTISHALRHAPQEYGITLDTEGWADLQFLLQALEAHSPAFRGVTEAHILQGMEHADKKRFEIKDGRIRAYYGHSVEGKIEKQEAEPPETLYHGTPRENLESILSEGLRSMSRQFVHLSADEKTASIVGRRYSRDVVILKIAAKEAHEAGVKFYGEPGDIWLADFIPPRFLKV